MRQDFRGWRGSWGFIFSVAGSQGELQAVGLQGLILALRPFWCWVDGGCGRTGYIP